MYSADCRCHFCNIMLHGSAVQPAARQCRLKLFEIILCVKNQVTYKTRYDICLEFVLSRPSCQLAKVLKKQTLVAFYVSDLTISTQIKFFKFIKYMVLNPQVRENVM